MGWYELRNGSSLISVPYSPSLSLKTLDTGILLLAVFTLELETNYPSETSLCTVAPFPIDAPSPIFFSEGRGRLYTGYLKRIIPSSNCPSQLKDKVRRIVHSKLKLFHFQIKTYYLSDANHQMDNLSLVWNSHFCCNECRAPALSWAFACLLCFFTKIIFKLTIDISMCKIMLEVIYFIKSMIYQMLKLFKRIAYFIPRWSEDLYFLQKNTG